MPSWINRTVLSGASVDENATLSHTCTFTPATAGNFLVVVVAGSVTCSTPSGWTLETSAVNNSAIYVFTKIASASESSFSTSHPMANFAIMGVVYEFPAGTTYVAGASDIGMTGTDTGPIVTGLTGTYARFSARSWCQTQPTSDSSTAWILPTIIDYDECSPQVTNDGVSLSIAYDDNQTAASFTPSSTTSNTNTAPSFGEGVAFALSIPAQTPQATLLNNAEGGTNGTAVTYDNSGGASGASWQYIDAQNGATVTYSNIRKRGNMAYRFTTSVTPSQTFVEWRSYPEVPTMYVRFAVFLPAYPSSSTRLCQISDTANVAVSIGLRTDGRISLRDNADTQIGVSSLPLPVGRWLRIELKCDFSATVGQVTYRLYTEVDSPYPAERFISAASFNTKPTAEYPYKARFGIIGLIVANTEYYMDDFGISTHDYLGPALATAAIPQLYSNNAEMNPDGTVITTPNSGDAVNNYFGDFDVATSITFSTIQAAHGMRSLRFQPLNSNTSLVMWETLGTPSAALRVYVYFTGAPPATTEFAQLTTSASGTFTQLARLMYRSAGNVSVSDSTGSILWTSSAALTLNTWYRFELFAQLGGTATTGTINAAYYALDSPTAIDSFMTTTANLGTVNFGMARFGKVNANAWVNQFFMDDLAVLQGASGYIGPYTAPPSSPVAYPGVIPHLGWGRSI